MRFFLFLTPSPVTRSLESLPYCSESGVLPCCLALDSFNKIYEDDEPADERCYVDTSYQAVRDTL